MSADTMPNQPKLSQKQILHRTLQPGEPSKNAKEIHQDESDSMHVSSRTYAHSKTKFSDTLRSRFGSDWISDHPLINPVRILEEAKDRPMSAALMCKQACVLINVGHHMRMREYLISGYCVACGFKSNPSQIQLLADEVLDGRSTKPTEHSKIEKNLLHYVFMYIFFQSGMVSRDRSTQYTQSLQYFFDRDATPGEVDKLLKEYGQNKLRAAAQRRANILQGAREWVQQGKDPTSVTMEEVLAAMVAEDAMPKMIKPENKGGDHNSRDIAPEDLTYRAEVESLCDEAEWLLENDPEKNPNATGYEEDDELEPDTAEREEDIQPPEVDEFFGDMMRLTAQMVVGLSDDRLDLLHRERMLPLVRELWIKVMRFRGLLA